jgi:two-component system response regulator YesN
MLVDDEPAFTDLMATLLETASSARVIVFNDPVAATRALGSTKMDLVVSDLSMPYMNGFEFLREVYRTHPHTPCVLATGNHLDASTIESERTPSLVKVLFKPVSWRDIAALLPIVAPEVRPDPSGSR